LLVCGAARSLADHTNAARPNTSAATQATDGITSLKAKAEKGDAQAQFELGKVLWTTSTNQDEAAKWFLKAAEQNHKGAFSYLGMFFSVEEGVAKAKV